MTELKQLVEALDRPILLENINSELTSEIAVTFNDDAQLTHQIEGDFLEDVVCGEYEVVDDELVPNCSTNTEIQGENEISEPDFENSAIKPRKIKKNEKMWLVTKRKRKYQAGEEFINNRKKIRPSKVLTSSKNCLANCRYKCATFVSDYERKAIFKNYYELDQSGKYHFIASTTERTLKNRKTTKSSESRRTFTFHYFFNVNSDRITVCKQFYLTTLAISQKPIYTVHNRKNKLTGSIPNSLKGKQRTKKISDDLKAMVISHIQSFPAVESHYCRMRSNKTYLESNLNVLKMYDLYVTHCKEQNAGFVKESYYRHLFNHQFNIDFHKPKSDRCGVCELHNTNKEQLKVGQYEEHNALKQAMRALKESHKQSGIPIICFDLENVITCPKSEIGEVFYHSKLNVYNLTAHLSTSKSVYCAVWSEYTGGRSGNDIASAFLKILERIFECNNFTKIITWSDSCVPQNKNSFMAYGIKHFLSQHPEVESIEMRYSLPGHSAIQEVDHAHSEIEKKLSKNEFFSPIGLLRLLKNINRRRPYTIIQMRPEDFKNFESPSKILNFKVVPFASLRMMKFTQVLPKIQFNLSYDIERYVEANLRPLLKATRKKSTSLNTSLVLIEPSSVNSKRQINEDKAQHLKSMFKFMSQEDVAYYKHIIKN